MALPVDYLSKIPQFAGKTKPIKTVLQLRAKCLASRDINFEFVTTVGDKLGALRSDRPRYPECDDSIRSVSSSGLNLFERFGGEVFEIDASPSSDNQKKVETGEKDALKTAPVKKDIENQRQVELSEALRWAVAVTSSR
jgi:hypothetical protein